MTTPKQEKDKQAISLLAPKKILEEYGSMAKDIGVSRSALMLMALQHYLDSKKALEVMRPLTDKLEDLADELKKHGNK